MRIKSLVLPIIFLFLYGCATSEEFNNKLNAWVGKTDSELIGQYGQPMEIVKLPNGDTSFVYSSKRLTLRAAQWNSNSSYSGNSKGASSGYSSSYTPAGEELRVCTVRFTIRKHVVISTASSGDDCRALSPEMQKLNDLIQR